MGYLRQTHVGKKGGVPISRREGQSFKFHFLRRAELAGSKGRFSPQK
jgi:hypothetical protein